MHVTKILAVSGSLRAASLNTALLRATARLAPSGTEVVLLRGLGDLPLFNPDLETQVPESVAVMRNAVAAADALLIASPEYAHGVTGTIKNFLDWLVSYEPFVNKPVAVFNASPRAQHADAALRETLRTMSAVLVEEACLSIPVLGSNLDAQGIEQSRDIARALKSALAALHRTAGPGAARPRAD